MPKIVDHDARRVELSQAVWKIVGEQGMEAVTVRSVAEAAGWSVGVLSHYFPTKGSLLEFAFELEGKRVQRKLDDATRGRVGMDALRELVAATLPLDAERITIARIWLGYMGRAANDRRLAESFRRRFHAWRQRIIEAIDSGITCGEISEDVDRETAADALMSFVDGTCMQEFFEPERCSSERQLALLEAQLDVLRPRDA